METLWLPNKVTYDATVDASAVYLTDPPVGRVARTEVLDDERLVDYDAEGRPVLVELLDVSRGVVLEGLPEPELVRAAVEALAARHGWPAPAVR